MGIFCQVCDAKMKITNIDPNYPGSTHDAYVWRMSMLREAIVDGHLNEVEWLLGMKFHSVLTMWLLSLINGHILFS